MRTRRIRPVSVALGALLTFCTVLTDPSLSAQEPEVPSRALFLAARGNDVQRSTYMSRVQAIQITGAGELVAGADPRGGAGVGRYPA